MEHKCTAWHYDTGSAHRRKNLETVQHRIRHIPGFHNCVVVEDVEWCRGSNPTREAILHLHSLLFSQLGFINDHRPYTVMQWEDQMARERSGYKPSYGEAKKKKSLTFHVHCWIRNSVLDYNLLLSFTTLSVNWSSGYFQPILLHIR